MFGLLVALIGSLPTATCYALQCPARGLAEVGVGGVVGAIKTPK